MPSGWNDKVSSLKVIRTAGGQSAIGDWISVTATEGIDFEYYLGFSQNVSEEEQDTESYSLSLQMNEGIKFGVGSASETVTESYSSTIMTDARTSMTKDGHVKLNFTCTGSVGPSGGVGLWQWVIRDGSPNVNKFVQTPHLVCRYNDLYNVKPKCPWNACPGSGDCSVCVTDWAQNGISPTDSFGDSKPEQFLQ